MSKQDFQSESQSDSDHSWVWARLNAYVSKNMLKHTKQRKLIIEYFLNLRSGHIGAEDVYEALKKDGHNIGLATVYRSLNLLKDAGILEQHTFADGRSVYEIDHPEQHHDHLVCVTCGAVEEFENEKIEELQHDVAAALGFKLSSHKLELFGECIKPSCPTRPAR